MPTQERNPIAVREVCSSRSQKPNVLPTKKKGRPEENPSKNIVSVLGRRKPATRCLCGLTPSSSMGASRNSTLIPPNLVHPDPLPTVTNHSERAQPPKKTRVSTSQSAGV